MKNLRNLTMALLHGGIVVTLFTCVVLLYILVLPVYIQKDWVLILGFILAAWIAHKVTNWLGYPFGDPSIYDKE